MRALHVTSLLAHDPLSSLVNPMIDNPYPSGSWQFAYKKPWLLGDAQQMITNA